MKIVRATFLLLVLAGCARPADETAAPSEVAVPADTAAVAALSALADSLANEALPADTRFVTVEVGGMVCDGCIELVGRELKAVAGVRRVSGSLKDQHFEVACDLGVADSSLTTAVRRAGPQYLGMIAPR